MNDVTFDVAIIGGGMSGLCAAATASALGARVAVVEKADQLGGSLALSGGLVWTVADYETMRQVCPEGRPQLQRYLVENIESLWDSLEEWGVRLEPEEAVLGVGRARLMSDGGPGDRRPVVASLRRFVEQRGCTIITDARTDSVEPSDEGVSLNGSYGSMRANAVITATGGFHASPRLVRQWIAKSGLLPLHRGNAESSGDGIALMRGLGAELSGPMSAFYGHSVAAVEPEAYPPNMYIPLSQYYTDHCLIIGPDGSRFVDESAGNVEEHIAQAAAAGGMDSYLAVFDRHVYETCVKGQGGLPRSVGDADAFANAVAHNAPAIEAQSREEVLAFAATLGFDPQQLAKTWDRFDDDTASPESTLLPPRERFRRPIQSPPFYAILLRPAITFTMGGLRIREGFAVDVDGYSPGRLFAAGFDAGGTYGGRYGGGLSWAGVSGMLAARQAINGSQGVTPQKGLDHL